MKKLTTGIIFVLFLWLLPAVAQAAEKLIPVGQVVGLELRDHCVTVAAFDEKLGAGALKAGGRVGDRVYVRVNENYGYWVQIRAIEKGEDDPDLPITSY